MCWRFFAPVLAIWQSVLRAISNESRKRKVLSVKQLSGATWLKRVISVPLVTIKNNYQLQMVFQLLRPHVSLVGRADSPAPNTHHWLSQCCSNKHRFMFWKCHRITLHNCLKHPVKKNELVTQTWSEHSTLSFWECYGNVTFECAEHSETNSNI